MKQPEVKVHKVKVRLGVAEFDALSTGTPSGHPQMAGLKWR